MSDHAPLAYTVNDSLEWEVAETDRDLPHVPDVVVQTRDEFPSPPPETEAVRQKKRRIVSELSEISSELVIRRASEIEPKPVDWLWQGRIAIGKHTIIAGEPGLGKSQLLCAIAAAVSTGREWPAGEGRAPEGHVIMFCAEDDPEDTIVPRLAAAGANLEKVHLVPAVRRVNTQGETIFDLQKDLEALEVAICDIGDVLLVTFDPLTAYLGTGVDTHKNDQTRRVLEPISALATRLGVGVVSITHSPKGQTLNPLHQFIGSVAFVAAPRFGFFVVKDRDDPNWRLFMTAKSNLAEERKGIPYRVVVRKIGSAMNIEAPAIEWGEQHTEIGPMEALASRANDNEPTALQEAMDFLRDILHGYPRAMDEVMREAKREGHSEATIKRAKAKLGILVNKHGFADNGHWAWSLPAELTD